MARSALTSPNEVGAHKVCPARGGGVGEKRCRIGYRGIDDKVMFESGTGMSCLSSSTKKYYISFNAFRHGEVKAVRADRELTFWLAKVACARAEWLVSGVGVDLAVITSPRPAFRLASHFVGLARHFAQSGLRSPCLGHVFSQNVNILVIAVNGHDEKPYPHASQLASFVQSHQLSQVPESVLTSVHLNTLTPYRPNCRDVPGNVYFPMASKWRAQVILPDAIKMGAGAACDENSRDSGHYTINGIGVVGELDSHPGIRTCPMPSQAILPDAIKELAFWLAPA
ncbi:hypothetical protein DFH07DRAFT_935843 [Mycena maculata]|uniref:Uncharacterized protein n=1 Tax=Mycena maculata TaxID=230809 RepID=A0AAD7KA83_9AGAR|nr:hypothetical protein DFH07DRAFT_935843 [Mycena maculata]